MSQNPMIKEGHQPDFHKARIFADAAKGNVTPKQSAQTVEDTYRALTGKTGEEKEAENEKYFELANNEDQQSSNNALVSVEPYVVKNLMKCQF